MKDQLLTELLPLKKDIEAIDPVVSFFQHSIEKELGNNLLAIVLFGSRARGDFKEHSDYDFLLLVANKSSELRDQVLDIEVETLDTFDKLISCLIWDKADWNFKKNFPIGRNILKEGMLLFLTNIQGKKFDFSQIAGKINFSEDPVSYQRRIRDEW